MPKKSPSPSSLILILALCGASVSLQQTLIIPQLPELPAIIGITPDDATWLVTATLLTGAVATPIVARLADMFGKRQMLLVSLAVMTVGSLVAVFGQTFPFLVAGRAMQGFASALIPVGISVLRDELPRERVGSAIALMSATLGIGAALGLPLSGVISQAFGWEAIFWFSAAVGAVLAVAVLLRVPESKLRTAGHFDIVGAIVLSIALVALLLGISKGGSWGWVSPSTIGTFAIGIAALAIWVPLELRVNQPMVDLRTLAIRPVLVTNVASLFVGISMFANMVITTQILEVPIETGFGFGLPVAVAGLTMVPAGLAMVVVSPFAGRMLNRWGGRLTLAAGAVLMVLAYTYRIFAGGSVLEIVIGAVSVSIGTALAFAAMPWLIMGAVPITETASANGANTLVRAIGTSVSSALIALIVAAQFVTIDDVSYPSSTAIHTVFAMGAIAAAIGAVCILFVPSPRRATRGLVPRGTGAAAEAGAVLTPHGSGMAAGEGTEQIVRGRVLLGDSDGGRRPAVVSVVTAGGESVDWARSDKEGNYAIALPGPGRYVAIANAQGWVPSSRMFDYDGGSAELDVRLNEPLALTGVVSRGATIAADATVVLTRADGEHVATAMTGEDGRYAFPLPSPGLYIVTAMDAARARAASQKRSISAQSIAIDLELGR